jgi:tousled-like kinase
MVEEFTIFAEASQNENDDNSNALGKLKKRKLNTPIPKPNDNKYTLDAFVIKSPMQVKKTEEAAEQAASQRELDSQTKRKEHSLTVSESIDQGDSVRSVGVSPVPTPSSKDVKIQFLQEELQLAKQQSLKQVTKLSQLLDKASSNLAAILRDAARLEREAQRKKMCSDLERLGRPVTLHSAHGSKQGWEGGSVEEEVRADFEKLDEMRKLYEEEKSKLRNMKKKPIGIRDDSNIGNQLSGGAATSANDSDYSVHESRELIAHLELFMKRLETEANQKEIKLQADRILHLKINKALKAQEISSYGDCTQIIGKGETEQYQILNMLGKGGFSEVYKGYDLLSHKFVAVKIHELKKEMSDDAKESYIKHVLREYQIHKQLKHRNIVQLFDAFALSEHAFCHVLELCEGVDLDTWLKAHGPMPEKEARGILIQVFSALRYMNEGNRRIIHYDLKPANLILDQGIVKIADFGLSKMFNTSHSSGETIELTSQGAGTYWYLPPECFEQAINNTSITKVNYKVDVWSVGVIFYELLFNRKPFGQGMSQEAVLRQGTVSNLRQDQIADIFPDKSTQRVSKEAKEFIRTLLTLDRHARPDVFAASNDPYLRKNT